ncbi:membrane protein [Actinocorallia lasiicapitis]
MDVANHFESQTTYRLIRLEYLAVLAVCLYLFGANIGDVNWWVALGLFLYIDLIGYLPGAIAYHRSPDRQIPKFYYVAYNLMHSFLTQGVVIGLWMLLFGPEWALLTIPIHLAGDRSLFGNFLKPFSVTFEPNEHPAFGRLRAETAGTTPQPVPPSSPNPAATSSL